MSSVDSTPKRETTLRKIWSISRKNISASSNIRDTTSAPSNPGYKTSKASQKSTSEGWKINQSHPAQTCNHLK
jgi:hypothetical protein